MTVQHVKTIRGAVDSYTEGHYKPYKPLSDQELKQLKLQVNWTMIYGFMEAKVAFHSAMADRAVHSYMEGHYIQALSILLTVWSGAETGNTNLLHYNTT